MSENEKININAFIKEKRTILAGQSNSNIENKPTMPWQKKPKKTNRQIIKHNTQHRKIKTLQHEPHQKLVSERNISI